MLYRLRVILVIMLPVWKSMQARMSVELGFQQRHELANAELYDHRKQTIQIASS